MLHGNLSTQVKTIGDNLSGNLEVLQANISALDLHVKQTTTTEVPLGFYPGVVTQQYDRPAGALPPRRISRRIRSAASSPWTASGAAADRPLIVLEDNASENLENLNSTHFRTDTLESGLISPQLGLVMEQSGSYMEYSGYIYVPIIYHMPHLIRGSLIGQGKDCNITANPQHQDMIIQLLKEKIGPIGSRSMSCTGQSDS